MAEDIRISRILLAGAWSLHWWETAQAFLNVKSQSAAENGQTVYRLTAAHFLGKALSRRI